jgi:hypothetical protein
MPRGGRPDLSEGPRLSLYQRSWLTNSLTRYQALIAWNLSRLWAVGATLEFVQARRRFPMADFAIRSDEGDPR